ncbi:CPBP family intramembrane glutamic endopeptidase [Simkania sp.]|uniref:CPBP family intramembrane glutamic endopeptidase n=1 Tax=Simkania sp. TaxID=34094 RepID=UPI003B521D1F
MKGFLFISRHLLLLFKALKINFFVKNNTKTTHLFIIPNKKIEGNSIINQLSSIGSTALTSAACFSAGYVLNASLLTINQIAAKNLGLPIDLCDGKSYKEYTQANLQQCKKGADSAKRSLDQILVYNLVLYTTLGVFEEVVHRYFIETVALPKTSSDFAEFSMKRTCISSLGFAAIHLANPHPKETLLGQFINTACLGVICSFAQHYFGLIGAAFLHIGFNVKGIQFEFDWNTRDFHKVQHMTAEDLAVLCYLAAFSAIGTPIYATNMLLGKIKHCFESATSRQAS